MDCGKINPDCRNLKNKKMKITEINVIKINCKGNE